MSQAGSLGKLYDAYRNKAEFFFVYITEAHPGTRPHASNADAVRTRIDQPQTMAERLANAKAMREGMDFRLPVIVDDMDNSAGRLYRCLPSKALLIGKDGRLAWVGKTGPAGGRASVLLGALKEAFPDVSAPKIVDRPRQPMKRRLK